MEITKNKITEIFCIIDDFCQEYDKEIARMSICEPDGRKHRNRKCTMSRSEIMTILICFHLILSATSSIITSFMSRRTCTTCSQSSSHITALLNSSPESRLR